MSDTPMLDSKQSTRVKRDREGKRARKATKPANVACVRRERGSGPAGAPSHSPGEARETHQLDELRVGFELELDDAQERADASRRRERAVLDPCEREDLRRGELEDRVQDVVLLAAEPVLVCYERVTVEVEDRELELAQRKFVDIVGCLQDGRASAC